MRAKSYPADLIIVLLALPMLWAVVVSLERDDERQAPLIVDSRVNPNAAPWWELTSLPKVGEVTAKAIIAYREQEVGAALDRGEQDVRAFKEAADLDSVPRIGVKTIARVAPHLRFR